ncbi:gas vesicle protein K [Streptomyces sp. WMMB 322]|uniref:gas vesicle protein K n=1 Tax=Streptomyces sp. WMMB 322 TaxID=1286821 RepID=UPI000823ADD5|nr:gas vesicle protein K [Streptomyces sp. WMMB 322]SCK52187.1 Gas vesicle protein K [Streptomyces sp. WMMB 322]
MTSEQEPRKNAGHDAGNEPAWPESGGLPERLPDGVRLDDVARSAARAFELLPAGPDDDGGGSRGDGRLAQRLRTDPDSVERDLMKLVLTIVELLRQLMERTALNRVDQGDLSEDQEERIGMTLMILHERMTELCDRYGLTMEDLNLDLGPLGSLLPRQDG